MRFVIDASPRSRVLVRGPDGPAFVHRLSTQHTSGLAPGEARLNVLTTDKGRIKDLVHHAVLDSDTILLVGQTITSDDLAAWLDRYCFSEKATFEPLSGPCLLVDSATADGVVPGAASLAPWGMVRAGDVVALRTFDREDATGVAVPTCLLVGVGPAVGALPDPTPASADDAAAMAAGVPGVEAGDAHTPLDLELHDAIHWSKGCYIGQEVIARLDTYGKQRKRLMGVVGDAATAGDAVVCGDVVVGTVTSAVAEPLAPASVRALALVNFGKVPPDAALPLAVTLRSADGVERPATLHPRRAAQQPHE